MRSSTVHSLLTRGPARRGANTATSSPWEILQQSIAYSNSAGDRFEIRVEDILLHVFLHGQYHRGKVNLLLRQAGQEPAPVDYIALARNAPAAVTPIEQRP